LRLVLSSHPDIEKNDIQWLLNNPGAVLSGSTLLPGATSPVNLKAVFVDAYKKGFRVIFLVGAGLSAFAFLSALVLLPQVELT
jgi:hypothetical protein